MSGLSNGVPNMPRRFSKREIRADALFRVLQESAKFLWIVGIVAGHQMARWSGVAIGFAAGVAAGVLVLHSLGLGIRASETRAFCDRMCARAAGRRRRLLEALIEIVRGYGWTRAQCRAMCAACLEARDGLNAARTEEERHRVLLEFDRKLKAASYDHER